MKGRPLGLTTYNYVPFSWNAERAHGIRKRFLKLVDELIQQGHDLAPCDEILSLEDKT